MWWIIATGVGRKVREAHEEVDGPICWWSRQDFSVERSTARGTCGLELGSVRVKANLLQINHFTSQR